MNINKHNIAAYLWSLGSILFFGAIIAFIFIYQPVSGTDAAKTDQLLNDWDLVSNIWRAETLAAVMLAFSSTYFAITRRSLSWISVAVAHIVMITMYGYLLGAYPIAAEYHGDTPYLFAMVNDTAVWIFGLSNFLFLLGMAGIYYSDELLNKWFSRAGTVISLVGTLGALALFFDMISFSDLNIGGPLILLLYLLNAYLGLRMAGEA